MAALLMNGKTGRFEKSGNNNEQPLRLTANGSLAMAQVEPPEAEILRAGLYFAGGCQVIASGIAPVAAIPTTTATLALVNGESDGGKSYLIDWLQFLLGSGTAAAGASLLLALSKGKVAAANIPAAAANYSTQSMSGGARASKAIWGTAVTIPAGSAWFAAVSSFQPAAANAGQGDQPALPKVLVPPGYALGIAILSGAGTSPLYTVSAGWRELEQDIE